MHTYAHMDPINHSFVLMFSHHFQKENNKQGVASNLSLCGFDILQGALRMPFSTRLELS